MERNIFGCFVEWGHAQNDGFPTDRDVVPSLWSFAFMAIPRWIAVGIEGNMGESLHARLLFHCSWLSTG